jgi:copper oxidase (laccase) domain-containing protein
MARATTDRRRGSIQHDFPIYPVFQKFKGVRGCFTGKGIDPQNEYFSFARPAAHQHPILNPNHFRTNLQRLARTMGFEPEALVLPNGAWPHSGQAIKDEDYAWVENPASGTLMPVTRKNQPVAYDAVASRSPRHVLAVQGADCPAIFLCDPGSRVLGLAHAGWKPLVRNVVGNVLDAMVELGAQRGNIHAYISPGVGDRYTAFQWDDGMEETVRSVFVQAGRSDLLKDPTIRHSITAEDRTRLQSALGREVCEVSTLKLSYLATTELVRCGLAECNISCNNDSTLLDRYPYSSSLDREASTPFAYHSFRREKPNHGLSISLLFLSDSDGN